MASPSSSPSPRGLHRPEHYDSKTAVTADNTVFRASVVLFTVLLFMIAVTVFVLCFRRFCLRRLAFHGDRDSVGLQLPPDEKPGAEIFPEFVYESTNYSEQGLECAVCLCEFEEEEKGRMLPACNHSFHVDCIDRWFDLQSTCPLCRAPARTDTESAAMATGDT